MLSRRPGVVHRGCSTVKAHVRVKFPWKLDVGEHSWIGESVWIDNLERVSIGAHCCISQGAYFCTGSHRWDTKTFDLVTKPIVVEDRCWIAAMVSLAPGTTLRQGAVLGMNFAASGEYEPDTVYLWKTDSARRMRR